MLIPISKIVIGAFRVRTSFNEEKLEELTRSIQQRGLLYPLVVKPLHNGTYELVAGERRLRAAKQAGLIEVPVTVRDDMSEANGVIEMGLENIQREDLSWYEKGRWVAKMRKLGYTNLRLTEETGITKSELSKMLTFYENATELQNLGSSVDVEEWPMHHFLRLTGSELPKTKQTEFVNVVASMERKPTRYEVEKAVQLMEDDTSLPISRALSVARSVGIVVPVPAEVMPQLRRYAQTLELTVQETLIKIVREYFESTRQ